MIDGFAARRPAAAASALAVLFVVGVLTSCGLDPKSSSISPERRSELQAVADKASRFSEPTAGLQRNTLLQFSAAEQDYRETLGLARELFPTDPARASYLHLHLALNKSNLGGSSRPKASSIGRVRSWRSWACPRSGRSPIFSTPSTR